MTLGRLLESPWAVASGALLAALFSVGFAAALDTAAALPLLKEGGPIEPISVALHLVAGLLALILAYAPGRNGHWRSLLLLIALCAVLMAAREMDLHKALTTHSVFSTKEYSRAHIPLTEKLFAGAFAATVIAALAAALMKARQDIDRLFRLKSAARGGAVALMIVIPALMIVDALPRMLRKAGAAPGDDAIRYMLSLEELGETALPLLVIVLILQVVRAGPFSQQ